MGIVTMREDLRDTCVDVAETDENTTTLASLESISCPDSCSGQGTCVNGTCFCNDGFVSEDCSINLSDPPEALGLDDNLCTSTIQAACNRVTMDGVDFVEGATCHFEYVEVTETGVVKSGNVTSVTAEYDSIEEVSCDVTQTGSLPLHAVLVSISNNGEITSQSAQHLFIAHNPVCWTCTITGTAEATCVKERASCLVDGVCYRPLDPSVNDPCKVCDVFTGNMTYQVSESCPPTTVPPTTTEGPQSNADAMETNDRVVIGLSAGMAALVLVIIAVAVTVVVYKQVHKKRNQDKDELTRRSRSSGNGSEEGDAFGEVMYPAFSNSGYYGYGPAQYLEAPQESFVDGIPVHYSNRRPDSTRYEGQNEHREHRSKSRRKNGNRHSGASS